MRHKVISLPTETNGLEITRVNQQIKDNRQKKQKKVNVVKNTQSQTKANTLAVGKLLNG